MGWSGDSAIPGWHQDRVPGIKGISLLNLLSMDHHVQLSLPLGGVVTVPVLAGTRIQCQGSREPACSIYSLWTTISEYHMYQITIV